MESTATVSKLTLEITPDQAAQQWVDAKEKIAGLEEKLEQLKPFLITYLKVAPKKTALLAGRIFKLARKSRQSLPLELAIEAFGEKKVTPLLKTSRWWEIAPCWKKRVAA